MCGILAWLPHAMRRLSNSGINVTQLNIDLKTPRFHQRFRAVSNADQI